MGEECIGSASDWSGWRQKLEETYLGGQKSSSIAGIIYGNPKRPGMILGLSGTARSMNVSSFDACVPSVSCAACGKSKDSQQALMKTVKIYISIDRWVDSKIDCDT